MREKPGGKNIKRKYKKKRSYMKFYFYKISVKKLCFLINIVSVLEKLGRKINTNNGHIILR